MMAEKKNLFREIFEGVLLVLVLVLGVMGIWLDIPMANVVINLCLDFVILCELNYIVLKRMKIKEGE